MIAFVNVLFFNFKFFLKLVAARYDNDMVKMRQLSIIEEEGGKRVNMAHLVKYYSLISEPKEHFQTIEGNCWL